MSLSFRFLFCLFICYNLNAQDSSEMKVSYLAFDSIVNIENTNLINGSRFTDNYRSTKQNHRFFNSYEFLTGSLIYEAQPFFDLNIKYDLYKDQVILQLPNEKNYFNVNLITDKISEFKIGNQQFKNFKNHASLLKLNMTGFLEIIHSSEVLNLYVKHKKSRKEVIKRNRLEHLFKARKSYLLLYNDIFYLIKSKKDVKRIFPNFTKFINEHYTNSGLLKRNPDIFMVNLFKGINQKIR